MKNKLKTLFVLLSFGIVICGYKLWTTESISEEEEWYEAGSKTNSPTSLHMYYLIEKYSKEYGIPRYVAFNVAYLETGYRGPFHWKYNPYQRSSAGAVGPMQIITRYAHNHAGRRVTEKELKTNLELNIRVSMSMLSKLYKMYGRWDLVLGYYNTGYPQVNSYASYASSNKNYKNKWIEPKKENLQ
jgi:soluble lytic murein transglycosylase-like protein